MSALLEVRNVSRHFGGLKAIAECDFSVTEGHAHGIIGPNGAGKTTLFNLITGIYKPTSGEIVFAGDRLDGLRPSRIALKGIGRTFQNIRLFKQLTVLENVRIAYDSQLHYSPLEALLTLPRMGRNEAESIAKSSALLEAFGLGALSESLAGDLPYGLQRKLEIARAIALNPRLLLLDEPAAGLNSGETAALTEFLRWVRAEYKVTLLLIEHHMHLVMGLCDRITVLDFGQKIAEGTPEEIRGNKRVIEAYLGAEEE